MPVDKIRNTISKCCGVYPLLVKDLYLGLNGFECPVCYQSALHVDIWEALISWNKMAKGDRSTY